MPPPKIALRAGPYVKAPRDVATIMRHVVYSLLPVCVFFIYQYGASALLLLLTVTLSCLATEVVLHRAARQQKTEGKWGEGEGRREKGKTSGCSNHWRFDLTLPPSPFSLFPSDWSATITGLLLALSLPPGFPLWMGALAGIAAIGLGKALFGGLGQNVFNPALVGRAFAQAAFPAAIALYTPAFLPGRFLECIPGTLTLPFLLAPEIAPWLHALHLDTWTGATPLGRWKFEGLTVPASELVTAMTLRATAGVAPGIVLLGGLYLALRRFLDWRIPVSILGTSLALAGCFYLYNPERFPDPLFVLFSGGLILGALYMATDMATSPLTARGVWLYGALIGVLTIVIRYFGGLPEGVMYAILIGNAAVPLIERVTQPKPFGHRKAESRGLRVEVRGLNGKTASGVLLSPQPSVLEPKPSILEPQPSNAPHAISSMTLVRTLGLTALLCGVIIVAAYQLTFAAAQDNRRIALERTIFKLLPAAQRIKAYYATETAIHPVDSAGSHPNSVKFYATFGGENQFTGIVVEAAANGYSGPVRLLYSYSPECACVTGLGVISLKETPGIGDKIITDRVFLDNFTRLDLRLDAALQTLAHRVVAVRHGSKSQPWEIDAIAGATVTSRAVARAIDDSATKLLPRLLPMIETVRAP